MEKILASDINEIDIDWIAGKVNIIPYDGDEIIVTETSRYPIPESDKMVYSVINKNLKIQYSQLVVNVFGNSRGIKEKNLEVKIPNTHNFEMATVKVVSADLDMSNMNAELLKISTVSGDVDAKNLKANKLSLSSVSGNMSVVGNSPVVLMDTVSGNSMITLDTCPNQLKASTVSGNVKMNIPENDGFTMKYSSVVGHVKSNFETSTNGKMLVYKNGTSDFKTSTVSGTVALNKI